MSLPRADTVPQTRRGTAVLIPGGHSHSQGQGSVPLPDIRRFNEELLHHNPRDFENAIEDADEEGTGHPALAEGHRRRTSVASAAGPGRVTVRLGKVDGSNTSVKSKDSSRSTSPPNSVAAFANPRVMRARAGTVNSRPGSDTDEQAQYAYSVHTRRPTFNAGSVHRDDDNCTHCTHRRDEEEDDVCMPPPDEWTKTMPIDFEVLEEFIAEKNEREQLQRVNAAAPVRVNDDCYVDIDPRSSAPELKQSDSDDSDTLNEKEEQRPLVTAKAVQKARRFTFFSSEQEAMIHASEIEDLTTPDVSFRDLFELPEDGGVWWLDCVNPTEDEIDALTKAFYVHPLTREDIVMQESREKVELFQKYYFVSFRSFNQLDKSHEEYLEPVNVYIVVFRTGVLSFTFAPCPHATNVIRRIGRLRDYVALSSDWICYALM